MSSRENRSTLVSETEDFKVREPIITKVLEKPQLAEVQEIKNVSVVHKDVVTEIHEQPIIEIAKKPETVHIQEQPFVQKIQAPTKYEDIKTGFDEKFDLKFQGPVHHTEEIGEVQHVNLGEDVKTVTRQELIERHIVPTVTEIREQKVINVIEQPIVRKITERTIVREVPSSVEATIINAPAPAVLKPEVEMRDSSLERERQLPPVQESTHVLKQGAALAPAPVALKPEVEMRDSSLERERQLPAVQESTHVLREQGTIAQTGLFSEAAFTEELSRGKSLLHNAHPLSTWEFKEEIKFGQEHLHTARPFAAEAFQAELIAQKKLLTKSRYFSKDAFIPEFMAMKKVLKPVEGNVYSEELSKLGNWKTEYFGKQLLESATGMFWGAYEKVSHKVADTYETVKEQVKDKIYHE